MDDPWDVKSVRNSRQYTSCMKINGVPLLPPVLSKECRSEMQYYKLLAKEVEKRISILQPYTEDDTDSSDDKTDAPEITDYDENENGEDTSHNNNKITDVKFHNEPTNSTLHSELYNYTCHDAGANITDDPHLIVDFSLDIKKTCPDENTPQPQVTDIPERDYNYDFKPSDVLTDVVLKNFRCKKQQDSIIEEIVNFSISVANKSTESYLNESFMHEGPPSLSTKSFTGSLNNIHSQSESADNIRPLVRQHSYTILNPSPQLLAHLEVQSLNLGVDMSCISMSESLTNLSSPGKKRRNWDLESAKAKWSNMAMELKQKNLSKVSPKRVSNRGQVHRNPSPSRAKCVAAARTKYSTLSLKQTLRSPVETLPKSRPYSPSSARPSSPERLDASSPVTETTSSETVTLEPSNKESRYINSVREPTSPKTLNSKVQESQKTRKEPAKITMQNQSQKSVHQSPISNSTNTNGVKKAIVPTNPSISESDDPAARVRELYEKIQQQQKIQMASLLEKQKREQILLHQTFEEQNNLLFRQLKTICPKSPEKAKEAWGDKCVEVTRGPVSLSQLISPKPNEHTSSPVLSTLADSKNCIDHCNIVLRKSKDLTNSIKAPGGSVSKNSSRISAKVNLEGSRTRTNSPTSPTRISTSTTSRRLQYDTNSERDYDMMYTDRTNDTLADLNVTFPTDSEESRPSVEKVPEVTVIHRNSPMQSTDSAIKCMEQTIQRSINSCNSQIRNIVNSQPTAKQQAAATKIVAHVKGYLVRRLMRTARVQSTVQTIKDALLCALELHQDREGIRGADVDLHRRLIQQITAACYSLHDTFITSTPGERCAMIAADRSRRASAASKPPKHRHSDVMSQSHSGVLPSRHKRLSAPSASLMTQSNYETYSSEKGRARYMPSPRRRPWR